MTTKVPGRIIIQSDFVEFPKKLLNSGEEGSNVTSEKVNILIDIQDVLLEKSFM